MIGGWVARIVPISGIVTAASPSSSSRNASKSSSARSISSISSTAGRGPGCSSARSSGRRIRYSRPNRSCSESSVPRGVGEPDAEQLARIVPLVQRLGRVDPLVALQADQRRVEHRRQRLAGLGLADAGLALEQQRLRQPQAQEHRRREPLVDEVVDGRQPLGERLDVGHELADLVAGLAGDPRSCRVLALERAAGSPRSRSRRSHRRARGTGRLRRPRRSCRRSDRPRSRSGCRRCGRFAAGGPR